MNRQGSLSRWRWPRLVALALTLTLCPLPALAGDQGQPVKKGPGIQASAEAIAARHPLEASPAGAQVQATGGNRSGSFFKTPIGIVVLATVAAGVGYAIYSTQNDRITSPAKN